MRIQHNITALNAHRNLTTNNSAVTKNLEKLSSGYRINRAGDDAAGLAISEKMRAQITGLQTAQKNAEDGVSLVQTAEGALTEVHSMLNRMVELATQSANGTYSEANRKEMQKEIDALRDEIDRIGNTANFNGTKLFGGGAGTKALDATGTINGAQLTGNPQVATKTVTEATWTDATAGKADGKFSFTVVDEAGTEHTFDVDVDTATNKTADQVATALNASDDLKVYGITVTNKGGKLTFTSDTEGSSAAYVKNVTYNGTNTEGSLAAATATLGKDAGNTYDLSQMQNGDSLSIGGKTYTYKQNATGDDGNFSDVASLTKLLAKDGIDVVDQGNNGQAVMFKPKADAGNATTIKLHVGEASDEANTIEVKIKAMNSGALGIDKLDISTAEGAKNAIDTINKAIDTVSSIRSDLGALQNRLEHTINNLGVQNENITAAESRIRDVDMAKEMMAYTKNNILVQSSQAMLAQANQVPQGVLQLLQ